MKKKILTISEKELANIINSTIQEVVYKEIGEDYIPEQMVNEALIYSYDADIVIRHITSTFNIAKGLREYIRHNTNYDGYVEKRKGCNMCDVILLALQSQKNDVLKEITLSLEKSCGWFLARKIPNNLPGIDGWQFEKKIENDATSDVSNKQFIYHLAPTSRVQKILHVGLVPRRTTWDIYKLDEEHTFLDNKGNHYGWKTIDRVYAFLEKPTPDFIKYNSFSRGKDVFTDTYTLLRIDISKLQNNTKFSYDVRSKNAVYTMNNILPSAISIES